MSSILELLNDDLGNLVTETRRSLVHVRNGDSGGAGTIWHPDGLIVTNAHVIRSAAPQVVLPDGRCLPARLLARDDARDVAALLVEASGLPAAEIGESRKLKPGQWVMAVGHPWGVPGAATAGVVIATGSDTPEFPAMGREWIEVSLPLRPGNSGGPLVDAQGCLVGMNTIMVGAKVGMAVPVHTVKTFLRETLGSRARERVAA